MATDHGPRLRPPRTGEVIPTLPSSRLSSACESRRCAGRIATSTSASGVPELVGPERVTSSTPRRRTPPNARSAKPPERSAQVRRSLRAEAALLSDPARPERVSPHSTKPRNVSSTCAGPAPAGACSSTTGWPTSRTRSTITSVAAIRSISRMMDETIETLTKGTEWDDLTAYLQRVSPTRSPTRFVELEEGRHDIRAAGRRDSSRGASRRRSRTRPSPRHRRRRVWQSKALDDRRRRPARRRSAPMHHRRPRRPGRHHDVRHDGTRSCRRPPACSSRRTRCCSASARCSAEWVWPTTASARWPPAGIAAAHQVRQFLDDMQLRDGQRDGAMVRRSSASCVTTSPNDSPS